MGCEWTKRVYLGLLRKREIEVHIGILEMIYDLKLKSQLLY